MIYLKNKLKLLLKSLLNQQVTVFLCALLSVSAQTFAANITVKIDRNPVMQDETFHITYETDTDVDASPDFSALYNDFDVLNSSQSTNMRLINGNYSMKKSWDLTLIGNKAGTFTIPSIPFGKDLSPALRVKVAKNADDTGKIVTAEIFVEVETDKKSAYIESEIIYTVRLVRSIEITQGSFTELETSDPDAIIINLGNIPQYTTTRKGKRYIVNEIRYAVYPQHSGKLTFKPLLFQGRISHSNSRSLFDQFLRAGEVKRIRSKKLTIKIKAKPSNIKADEWLPAKKLSINEEWSSDLSNIKVGEPITRTITINANGFTAKQLPELNIKDLDKLKQYPDQAVTQDTKTANGISSTKQTKVAIIPTQAGLFKLPEIAIPWWNTKTNRLEIAKIPEAILTAVGSASNLPIFPTAPATTMITTKSSNNTTQTSSNIWFWVSLTLGLGWLVTVVTIGIKNKKTNNKPRDKTRSEFNFNKVKPFENAVKNACQSNDAVDAKNALIHWASAVWQSENFNSLADIAGHGNPAFCESLTELNGVLYSSGSSQWDGSGLLKEFNHFRVIKRYIRDTHTTQLEPLYK